MPRILLLSVFCFFLFGCEEEGGGLIERETDSSPSSSSENSESGGDSSDSGNDGSTTSGVFNIKPYLDASVSTDSMEGIWVAIGIGQDIVEQQEDDGEKTEFTRKRNVIQFFTVTSSGDGYRTSICTTDASNGSVTLDGDSLSISGFGSGTLKDNKYAETVLKNKIVEAEGSIDQDFSFKLAKIKDATSDFGSLNLNIDGTETTNNFDCFIRDEYEVFGYLTEIRSTGETSLFVEHSRSVDSTYDVSSIYIQGGGISTYFDTEDGHDVRYEFNEFEPYSIMLTISGGSSDPQAMTGTMQIAF